MDRWPCSITGEMFKGEIFPLATLVGLVHRERKSRHPFYRSAGITSSCRSTVWTSLSEFLGLSHLDICCCSLTYTILDRVPTTHLLDIMDSGMWTEDKAYLHINRDESNSFLTTLCNSGTSGGAHDCVEVQCKHTDVHNKHGTCFLSYFVDEVGTGLNRTWFHGADLQVHS